MSAGAGGVMEKIALGASRLRAEGAVAPVLAFVVFLSVYIIINPALLTRFQLQTAMNLVVPLALATLAQMLIVVVGGIDISIGAVLSLVNVVFALSTFVMPIPMAVLVGIGTGIAAGLINGFLVAYGRLPAIAVTLATFFIFGAITRELMDRPGGNISYEFFLATSGELLPYVPMSLFWLLLICVGLWYVLQRTTLGRHIYAVGSHAHGLEAAGVNSRRTVLIAFGISGLLIGLAGIMLAGSTLTGDPRAGDSYLLNSIAAVALAGVSFAGGRGSILGAVLAAFTLGLIGNFLFFAGINSAWQFIVAALILFSVVAIPAAVTIIRQKVKGVA